MTELEKTNPARTTFNRPQTSRWLRCEISRRTKRRIYEVVVGTILLSGCETWPLSVEDQRRLEVFDNDSLRRILGRRRLDRVPCVDFVGSGMLRDVLPAKLSAKSSNPSSQFIGVRSVAANSKRG